MGVDRNLINAAFGELGFEHPVLCVRGITKAYRALARKIHPDKLGGADKRADRPQDRFIQLNAAFNLCLQFAESSTPPTPPTPPTSPTPPTPPASPGAAFPDLAFAARNPKVKTSAQAHAQVRLEAAEAGIRRRNAAAAAAEQNRLEEEQAAAAAASAEEMQATAAAAAEEGQALVEEEVAVAAAAAEQKREEEVAVAAAAAEQKREEEVAVAAAAAEQKRAEADADAEKKRVDGEEKRLAGVAATQKVQQQAQTEQQGRRTVPEPRFLANLRRYLPIYRSYTGLPSWVNLDGFKVRMRTRTWKGRLRAFKKIRRVVA